MKNGFTYKGRHTSEFGITVKTDDRPIYPEVKSRSYEPLLSDGSYDFTAANIYGREFYKNRTFSVIMQLEANGLQELNRKISKIAVWLCGAGELIFDDTPMVVWAARCNSKIKYAPERRGKSAILTAAFEVPAFAALSWKTQVGPKLSDGIRLDSDIPLNIADKYIISPRFIQNPKTMDITADFTIVNIGDRPLRPIITIDYDGAGGRIYTPYICLDDKSVGASIGTSRGINKTTLIYDFEKQRITCNGERCKIDGDFFDINSGDTLKITMHTSSAASVLEKYWSKTVLTIDANPHTVWDFDFNSLDWGDDSA